MTILISISIGIILLSTIRAEPLLKSFSSCLGQHTNSLAPVDQLINFNQLWTQLDLNQQSKPEEPLTTNHLLRISLIGQVGSQSTGYSPQTNFLSTLISETSILNFQSFSNQSALCSSIRTPANPTNTLSANQSTNSGCPYGPGQLALGLQLPISSHSDYPFLTLSTQLQLLDTSTPALTLACIQLDTSPYYPQSVYFKLLTWIPVLIVLGYLIVCWSARLWAAIISEQLNREAQVAATLEDIPLKPTSSFLSRFTSVWWLVWSGQALLLSGALLRFSTPGTRDLINHLQFISLLGLFSVQWPEFVYPILTQPAWTTLIFNSTIVRTKLPYFVNQPNPLSTPAYEPPQSFLNEFDTITSPLYLNRTLPNLLLNYGDQRQGIPRWATTIGILPRDLFGIAISVFAVCSSIIAAFSALTYITALIATLISSSPHLFSGPPRTKQTQRDSGIFTSAETDDGRTCSPPTTTRVFHQHQKDQTTSTSQPEKGSLFDSLLLGPAATDQLVWPQISHHFALLQGNLLRLLILFYRPLVVFAAYQLTLIHSASIFSIVIAAIVILVTALLPALLLYRLKGLATEELIDSPSIVLSLGPLYNTFDDKNVMFMGVRFASSFIVGIAIGAAQSHGIIQSVILLIAELTETMLTSLWLPWGEGAAMAPLTFISSVSRIITAVILVVMTPSVAVGTVASAWLTYVILLILGGVLGILVCVLVVKLVELLLRLGAHIPFDETRSTRAGGLRGAWRRWDRSASRSTRHGRAAAIAARRQRRTRRKPTVTSRRATRASIFSVLNGQSPGQGDKPAELNGFHGPSSLSPGFGTINDDDGNIMSAMSQGAWLRTPAPETLFGTAPVRPSLAPPDRAGYPSSTPSSGFAVVRGGRATEKTPYLMHNDGRNSWRPAHRPHDYPPSHHLTPSPSSDFAVQHPPSGFFQAAASSNHQLHSLSPGRSTTTTNLFDQPKNPFPLSGHTTSDDSVTHRTTPDRRNNRANKNKKKQFGRGLFGMFLRNRSDEQTSSSSDSSSSSDDDDDEEEEDSEGDDDEGSGSGLEDVDGQGTRGRRTRKKLKNGVLGGLDRWRRKPSSSSQQPPEGEEAGGRADLVPSPAFQVVRQPRLRPSPNGSASTAGSHLPKPPSDQLPPPPS